MTSWNSSSWMGFCRYARLGFGIALPHGLSGLYPGNPAGDPEPYPMSRSRDFIVFPQGTPHVSFPHTSPNRRPRDPSVGSDAGSALVSPLDGSRGNATYRCQNDTP